jgi:hypothetical protein
MTRNSSVLNPATSLASCIGALSVMCEDPVLDAAAARQRAAFIAPPYVALTAADLRVEEGEG